MGVMNKFESMMQGIVEGSFGKIFRTRLQTVELFNKLVRAMENNADIRLDQHVAPNVYHVHLSRRDYDTFFNASNADKARLQDQLKKAGENRHLSWPSRPVIIYELDDNLTTGEVRIDAHIQEIRDLANDPHAAIEATRSMSPAQAAALVQQAQAQAQGSALPPSPPRPPETLPPTWLTLIKPASGQPMRLTKPVIQIGRHLTNDVVINGKRVSRHHAQIRYEHGQWVLYDLGSTNGVGINGVLTHQPVPLKNNDRVAVGEFEFVFQRR